MPSTDGCLFFQVPQKSPKVPSLRDVRHKKNGNVLLKLVRKMCLLMCNVLIPSCVQALVVF